MKEFVTSLEVTLKVIEFSLWAGFTAVCIKLLVEIWKRVWGHRR